MVLRFKRKARIVKVSIVTATYNSARTLGDTMKSVLKQTYPDIEYIVVDGSSTDNTKDVIRQYEPQFSGRLKWVSEKDGGIYDAMNKGIRMATGDIVGILNSDDYFTGDDVIERMVVNFDDPNIDAVYGDIHFIHDGEPDKIVRYYSSKPFRPMWLRLLYKTDYQIGSDYEMMVRLFMVHKIRAKYLPIDFVTMRTGGASTKNVKSRLTLIKDDVRGCRENGIYTNPLMVSLKFFYKVFELRR